MRAGRRRSYDLVISRTSRQDGTANGRVMQQYDLQARPMLHIRWRQPLISPLRYDDSAARSGERFRCPELMKR